MRGKHAALIAALLLLTTACSRSAPTPVSAPSAPAPTVPELPAAKVTIPPEAIVSTLDLASLPNSPVPAVTAHQPVTAAADAEREKAKASLITLLEASTAAPAKGLEEALLAYYRRPDVAALHPSLADPPHVVRVTEVVGTKEDPSPFQPTIIRVGSVYEGASPWYLSVLQWQSGGKIFTASLKQTPYSGIRGVAYRGRPAFLLFDTAGLPVPVMTAFVDQDGQLQPLTLQDQPSVDGVGWRRLAPNQLQFPGKPVAVKPGYGWACFATACVTLGWNETSGFVTTPAGFPPAEAQKRLASTDGNVMQVGWETWVQQIDDRVAAKDAMDVSVQQLAERTGGRVAAAASGDTVARVVSITGSNWTGGKGYELAATWLAVRSPGAPDQTVRVGGGVYVDHRILRDGDRTYVLLLTEAEPRPVLERNVLRIYALQGGKLVQLQLPETMQLTHKTFTSMDGRLLLTCPDSANAAANCGALRIEGGKLTELAKGFFAGPPSAEAQQARAKGTAKFQAGAYAEAAQLFRQAVELAPTWVDGWNDLSFAYQKAGDWSAALLAAHTAYDLDQKSGPALYNLGVSYLGIGNPSRAVSPLEQAANLQQNSVDSWLALGQAREQARLRITALEAYKKVLALDPANQQAADGVKRMQAVLDAK